LAAAGGGAIERGTETYQVIVRQLARAERTIPVLELTRDRPDLAS